VSTSEILGPIDEITLLRKMTSRLCIIFYGILEEFWWPTKTVKSVSLKIVKIYHTGNFAQLFIYINKNSLDKNELPLYLTCIPYHS